MKVMGQPVVILDIWPHQSRPISRDLLRTMGQQANPRRNLSSGDM